MKNDGTIAPRVQRGSTFYLEPRHPPRRSVELDAVASSEQRQYYVLLREVQRKGSVQTNVGRIQQDGCERYERMLNAASRLQQFLLRDIDQEVEPAERIDRSGGAATVPNLGCRVLEVLDGFVDQISEGVAYVTLKSQFGDVLHGEYPASELNRRGIQEGRGFRCITIESNGIVSANIEAIPERKLTPQEQLALFDEADKRLGDFEWDE